MSATSGGRRAAIAVGVALAVLGATADARAQSAQAAAAESAFSLGRRLLAEGRAEEACAAFRESMRLEQATGTLYNIGLCSEASGKTATAWSAFKAVGADEASNPERARTARERAAALGLLGRHVFFYDEWVPYERRADFLLEATLAVSLHRDHLETAYAAVRSRFLDHLWAGLPSVVSAGDAAADLVARHDLGLVMPPGDARAAAATLIAALEDKARLERWSANARELAARYTWERTLAPLARFCAAPRKRAPSPPVLGRHDTSRDDEMRATMERERGRLIQQLEAHWQLAAPPQGGLRGLAQRLALRLLAPVLAEQRAFNAAVVRTIYALTAPPSEPDDQGR